MVSQLQKAAPDYIWKDIYPTWGEACKAARAVGGEGLGGERWFQRITQQITDYRNEFRQYGIAMPPRPCNLPLVCAMTAPSTVVDLGGSSGWCWDYLRNSLPSHNISSYVIVEIESVARHMQDSGLHDRPVHYRTMDDLFDHCDLLYCNSVMQYFESNAPLISLAERATPDFIFLEDIMAKGEEDFFTTQSFYNSAIPYRFIGLNKLLQDMASLGYQESFICPYASPVLGVIKPFDMENFPEDKRLRYSLSIFLSKSGAR